MANYTPILKQADIFYQLTQTQLEMVGSVCEERQYSAGELVFHQGADTKELYVIAKGEVGIEIGAARGRAATPEILARGTGPLTIATMRRGQSFGEIALVDEGYRSASARAMKDGTTLLVLPREKPIGLCEMDPQLGYRLMRNLAADLAIKLRNTDLRIREEIITGPRNQA